MPNEQYERTENELKKENNYLSSILALKHADPLNPYHIPRDTADFPLNTLPYPEYRGFYGREDILKLLETTLVPAQSSRGIKSVLLHGLGGVGKSQTALAFAHRNSSSFDAIFWVRSETKTSLKDSFTEIALALQIAKGRGEGHDEENFLYFLAWVRKQEADKLGASL